MILGRNIAIVLGLLAFVCLVYVDNILATVAVVCAFQAGENWTKYRMQRWAKLAIEDARKDDDARS
jgi:hypothetical protein